MLENEVKDSLLNIVDRIDAGTSNLNEDSAIQIIELANKLTNTENKFSKYQACKYIHKSRATFDNWVREGKLPKGRKEQGFTELFWTKEDLDKIKKK